MSPLLLIPAAGASKRMRGGDKLLETIDGVPLLRRQAFAALTTGCPVLVTLRPQTPARRATIDTLPLSIEEVAEAGEGLSASLRTGAHRLAPGQPLGVLLPDVPGVTTAEITKTLEIFRDHGETTPTRASQSGTNLPGTPLFLPHDIAKKLTTLHNAETGQAVLKDAPPILVPFPDDRATRDLDTPEDWAKWRAETGTPS